MVQILYYAKNILLWGFFYLRIMCKTFKGLWEKKLIRNKNKECLQYSCSLLSAFAIYMVSFSSLHPIQFSSRLVEIHPKLLSINTGPWKLQNWILMISVRSSSVRRKLRKLSSWELSKRWMWTAMATLHTVNWRRPLPLWVVQCRYRLPTHKIIKIPDQLLLIK